MNRNNISKIGLLLIALIISMPICFSIEMSLLYDSNGNLIAGDGKYRVYNSLNQLWKVYNGSDASGYLMEEYTYHPVEERVLIKKEHNSSGTLIETTYYFNKNNIQIVNISGTYNYTYLYHNGQLVAQQINNSKIFYHTDIKGDVIATTNQTGAIIEQTTYSPYGELISGGASSRYGYEGKEHNGILANMVGNWPLDANTLTTGGYTFYNGVAVGASQNSFGKYGGSYYFDGNNDYINISKNVLSSSNFTVMFWSYTPSANNNTGYILCDANSVSNLFFRRYDTGLNWNGGIAGVNMGSTTTNVPRDEWVHTAIVLNGSNAYIYVNGVRVNMTGTTTGMSFSGLNTSLFLGNRQALDRDYEGYLDNFQVYSRAMSQSEIQSVYNLEHPLIGDRLSGSYEFEQAVNDSNNLISGQYGGAYRFEHQYVDIPDYNALDLSNEITISAWIYPTSGAQGYVVSKWRSYILQFLGSGYGNTTQGALYIGGAWTPLATSAVIPLNSWSHVVFTYDKKVSRIYVNGVLSGSQSYTGSIDTNNNSLTIGARNSTDRTRDFNGTIDEVKVYGKALTPEQVESLYLSRIATTDQQIDFHARMYSPTRAQFNQPDSIINEIYNPQNLNRFSFEGNSPYNRVDPDGHIAPLIVYSALILGPIVVRAIAGAVAGYSTTATINVADQVQNNYQTAGNNNIVDAFQNVDWNQANSEGMSAAGSWAMAGAVEGSIDSAGYFGKGGDKIATMEGLNLKTGGSSSLRGASNPKIRLAIQRGTEEHAKYYTEKSQLGMITNKALPGTRLRPDAVDMANRMVYELKPNNPSAITRGTAQAKEYSEIASNTYGGEWGYVVETYK